MIEDLGFGLLGFGVLWNAIEEEEEESERKWKGKYQGFGGSDLAKTFIVVTVNHLSLSPTWIDHIR